MTAPVDLAHIEAENRQHDGTPKTNRCNTTTINDTAHEHQNENVTDSSNPTACNDAGAVRAESKGHSSKTSYARSGLSSSCEFYYLTPQAAQAIRQYQYRGEDRSLLYQHILSPLAQYLVDNCTPHTVAPNTITLLGLCLMVASYGVIWYHVPSLQIDRTFIATSSSAQEAAAAKGMLSFDDSVPRWVFLYNCVAMLIYQTLDNMDGKQARRTHSSSPLGLLFDHGCDAINSIFGSANWIVAMGLDLQLDALWAWTVVVGPYALFYVATWEEYYTGELILPEINGPNEGLCGGALLSFTTYLYGPEFWHSSSWYDFVVSIVTYILPITESLVVSSSSESKQSINSSTQFSLRNADVVVLTASIGICREAFSKFVSVSRKYGGQAMLDMLPFFVVSFATLLIGWCDKTVWLEIPRTALHLVACLMVEMVSELMRAHISNQKFQPVKRWLSFPLLAFTVTVLARAAMGLEKPLWTHGFLTIYTTAAWTYLGMKLIIIIDEICRVLNIWCFDIVTPRRSPTADSNELLLENQHPKID